MVDVSLWKEKSSISLMRPFQDFNRKSTRKKEINGKYFNHLNQRRALMKKMLKSNDLGYLQVILDLSSPDYLSVKCFLTFSKAF